MSYYYPRVDKLPCFTLVLGTHHLVLLNLRVNLLRIDHHVSLFPQGGGGTGGEQGGKGGRGVGRGRGGQRIP